MVIDNAGKFVEMQKTELIADMNNVVNKIISGNCSDEKDYRASCASYITMKGFFEKSEEILKKLRKDEEDVV